MIREDIISAVRDYVLTLFLSELSDDIHFHNVKHTREVVNATVEIAQECHFTPRQLEIVILAAWFHDCGYTTTFINHEDSSKSIAKDFLEKNNYPADGIEKILACIEATRFPQNATSIEEEVLADADLYHFTKSYYPKYEQKLRKEFEIYLRKTFTDLEWANINYRLLKNHRYYTDYGKNVLQKFKEVNINRLEEQLSK